MALILSGFCGRSGGQRRGWAALGQPLRRQSTDRRGPALEIEFHEASQHVIGVERVIPAVGRVNRTVEALMVEIADDEEGRVVECLAILQELLDKPPRGSLPLALVLPGEVPPVAETSAKPSPPPAFSAPFSNA